MKPAPPVTSARISAWRSRRAYGRRQSAQKIENGVADREMTDLDKTVAGRRHVKVPFASEAQRIVRGKSAHGRDPAASRLGGVDRIEDVLRAPRARDRDHKIAGPRIQLDLVGEHPVEAEIIAEAGQHAAVVKR